MTDLFAHYRHVLPTNLPSVGFDKQTDSIVLPKNEDKRIHNTTCPYFGTRAVIVDVFDILTLCTVYNK